MKRLYTVATISTLAVLVSGCSAFAPVEYDCALAEVQAAKCASMDDAYKMSQRGSREGGTGQSVFGSRGAAKGAPSAATGTEKPFFRGEVSNFPDAAQQGAPVFKQPKVMRVWVAPYVDADGNLRSGEYTYFATPGAWNYGSLTKAGSASGMFEPVKPNQLGFIPVEASKTRTTPTGGSAPLRPSDASASMAPQAPTSSSSAVPAAPAEVKPTIPASAAGGITQPYQRLSN